MGTHTGISAISRALTVGMLFPFRLTRGRPGGPSKPPIDHRTPRRGGAIRSKAKGARELRSGALRDAYPRRRSAPLVFACRLCLGDTLALALKHHLALELRKGCEHRQEKISGRSRRVHRLTPEVKYPKGNALLFQKPDDFEQVTGRSSEPINLGDNQRVALPDEIESGVQGGALTD